MFYVITNPISGRNKKKSEKIKKVLDYLKNNNIEHQIFESQYYRHPVEIAKKITTDNESGNIIVIGGDGTFNEVINGITNLSNWNVGLIPAGSGNDFAKAIDLDIDNPIDTLKKILTQQPKPVDYILVNDQRCVNVLGTGIDVEVLINFEKHTKMRGSFRYFYSLLEALCHLKWHEFDVSLDDGPFEHKKGLIITLCNGSNIGGGIPICPGANPSDNKLEFVFVSQVKKSKILGKLIKLMKGKILTCPEATHIYCKKAVFKDANPLQLQIDGNINDKYNEYRCEIVENGLNMYR